MSLLASQTRARSNVLFLVPHQNENHLYTLPLTLFRPLLPKSLCKMMHILVSLRADIIDYGNIGLQSQYTFRLIERSLGCQDKGRGRLSYLDGLGDSPVRGLRIQ